MQKYLSNQLIINYTFMNIAIVGTGYVGLVSGTCFADTGANVTCVDVDAQKIERLKNGEIPIFEPGLDELVVKNVKAGRLHFTTDLSSVLDDVQIVFSAVGTPPDEDGSAGIADRHCPSFWHPQYPHSCRSADSTQSVLPWRTAHLKTPGHCHDHCPETFRCLY